jgi:muramoyltetrapeptide carboxypeptidase
MTTPLLPIYCFAPSGKVTDFSAIERAKSFLNEQGFSLHNSECVVRMNTRFAGTDIERVNEINDLPEITASIGPCIALAIRGGYGLGRLLTKIQWERLANAVDDGLNIVGHSDITSLQIALFAKTERKSYAGPMLSYDFGAQADAFSQFTWDHFYKMMLGQTLDVTISKTQDYLNIPDFQCEGTLWGGNLSILNSLLNTSYFPDKPLINNGILFIEDINEHPYRVERMLTQLLHAGILETQQAILLGDFSGYQLSGHDDGYDLESCIGFIKNQLRDLGAHTQILRDLPFGHCANKLTLPIGKTCQITANRDGFSLKGI